MAVAANQQPITVTYTDRDGESHTAKVQPLVGLDGGDGTRIAPATKEADNVWTPFRSLSDTTEFTPAPATRTSTAGDDTATIAAGLAQV